MSRQIKMEGGFAYRNTGTIKNSYAAVKIGTAVRFGKNKSENAGFVYDNSGELDHCFSRSIVRTWRKGKDGLIAVNKGRFHWCFFVVGNDRKLKKFRDREHGFAKKDVVPAFLEDAYQWDFTVFEREPAGKMEFLQEQWRCAPNGLEQASVKKPLEIASRRQLLDWIERVNRGEPEAAQGSVLLTQDLDFHGKEIPSIGCDRQHPFLGTFDGGGHEIKGFILNGKGMAEIGFFGVLKGTVRNLTIDCIVKGKNCPLTAAFCAVNEGEIHCCEALCSIHANRYVGGFVGENNGVIERCCVSGKSHGLFLIWLFPFLPYLALLLLFLCYPPLPPQDYVPVMADAAIIPNTDNDFGERTNDNKASYEVPKVLRVDTATLTAESEPYVIKNPSRGANYDFVAVLYMTDSSRKDVEIYRSGRIPVGFHIENLTLTPPEGIVLTKGTYEAKMVFSFYNHDTGEKGMVDSVVPITVELK